MTSEPTIQTGRGSVTTETVLHRMPDVLFRYLDDEVVLYDGEAGNAVALDPIATLVWRCLEEPASIDELAPDFAEAYETDAATIAGDLLAMARSLHTQGFLGSVQATVPVHAADPTSEAAAPVAGESSGTAFETLPEPPGH